MITKRFKIGGMTCTACASGLERILKKNEKVRKINVNFATEMLDIEYDEDLDFSQIEKSIKSLGFYIIDKSNIDKKSSSKLKLIISIIFTIILLYIAMAHMITTVNFPYPYYINPTINPINFAIIQFMLCLPVIIIGYKFYIVGYHLLFKKTPNMDSLIAIGTTASFLYSIYALYKILTGNVEYIHNLYFESTATIITLVELGKYLESKSKARTQNAIKTLINYQAKTGIVIRNGKEQEINIKDIEVGDIVIVKSGQKIPVDGKIIEGAASIDEALITGESIPVDKAEEDSVIGATINKNGYIKYIATKVGKDMVLSQIIKLVENAQTSKAPSQKLADKVSGYFTITVLILAIMSSAIWLIILKDVTFAIKIFVSVLVIACPCALGLATPIAIIVGTGKGAKLGILFKDAQSLENLSKINTMIFDKTGTLTKGKPEITDIIPVNINKENLLNIASSVEAKSEHPLSVAITKYAKENNVELKQVKDFRNIVGKGVYGKIDNLDIYIGNITLINELKIDISKINTEIQDLLLKGKTIMYVIQDNNLIGVIAVADTVRDGSKNLIENLNKLKIETYMLTGDNELTAKVIANELKIEKVIANTLPENKAEKVRELVNLGKNVAMCGDGINDSPALVEANVGIAIGNGTDVAIETAGVILVKNNILDVLKAIKLSKKTMRIIKQNLFWAFIYNSIGIPIAMGILYIFGGPLLNPMLAALAMTFSSISVVTNALRINKFE